MTPNPCNPCEEHDKTGGVPAPTEPTYFEVHVTVEAAITKSCVACLDAEQAKSVAEGIARTELVKLGYEILEIESKVDDGDAT